MTLRLRSALAVLVALALPAFAPGCAPSAAGGDPLTFEEAPVSDLGSLMAGAPDNSTLPDESKADEILPRTFDLMELMTPVRSQGRRGTCTIFATTALMESLYVAEGSMTMPDFSEQFLQWSSKVEGMSFTTSEGSNPRANLEAISRFGIVEETAWPYEVAAWGASNDAACAGEEAMRPVRCFTNGEPPAAALSAMRFRLPAGRWVNSRRNSLMSYMVNNRLPVVVSGTFYYQAWNHGGSMLPVSSALSARGVVMYPNAEDIADSGARPAGHGILLLGFDQDMTVQRVDGMGRPMVDAMGNPVNDVGFFLFKNSWGTGRFGTENPMGPGYGWSSMRYVEEFMTAYVSGRPTVTRVEICNNTTDDDRDGRADCMDSDCGSDRACMDVPTATTDAAMPALAIPDNSTTGATSTITVAAAGNVSSVAVTVNVTHPYRGDLRLVLEHGGRTVTLLDRVGAGEDDVHQTFSPADFNGIDAAGAWTLRVVDTAHADVGTLADWSVAITRCMGSCGGADLTTHHDGPAGLAIPDATTAGVTSDITITDAGTLRALAVNVAITHSFIGDLTIRLQRVGGREIVLLREQLIEGSSLTRTFAADGFIGEAAAGTWRLTVVDGAARDTGTLDAWSMDVTAR